MNREVYFDNSATTKPFDAICDEIGEIICSCYGNPSSLHGKGVNAENILKNSRKTIAGSLGVDSGEIFFTSGGTESNNIAILGTVEACRKRLGTIITTSIEHASVLETCKYLEKQDANVLYIPVDSEGIINLDILKKYLDSNRVSLLSIMHVNNEMGSIQPIEEIIKLKKTYGFVLHIDAVQSYCKVDTASICRHADFLSVSGHKIHALKGSGVLYAKKGSRVEPPYHGGGQEGSIKPGTENMAGIWSLGCAVEINSSGKYGDFDKVRILKENLVGRILEEVPGTRLNGTLNREKSAPHIANISFKDIPGEVMLHALEGKGIYVSTGSACSSKKSGQSHVLTAMGMNRDNAGSSVRFSLSLLNTGDDVDYCVEAVKDSVSRLAKKR